MIERRFGDREVAWILRHAAESDRHSEPESPPEGLSVRDLEEIADEVGIDPAHIATAIETLDRRGHKEPKALRGPRLTAREIRSVPGRLSPQSMDELTQRAQRREYDAAAGDGLGARIWSFLQPHMNRRVSLEPTSQRTLVRVEEQFADHVRRRVQRLPTAGAAVAGLLLGAMALGGPLGGILVAGVLGSCCWLIADSVLERISAQSRARARAVADRLAEDASRRLRHDQAND